MELMALGEAKKLMGTVCLAFFRATEHIMGIYARGNVDVERKGDGSPVTEADKGANRIILGILQAAYPDYAVLAEETYDSDRRNARRLSAKRCFIVDPLDGTKEFIARIDQFSICIAVAEEHEIIAGAVFAPVQKLMYYAARGLGAYRVQTDGATTPEFFAASDRIHVSGRRGSGLIAMVSRYHTDPPTAAFLEGELAPPLGTAKGGHISKVITAGSALKGCAIAAGEADIYYRFGHTMEWDTAANQVIVEEAGGVMRQLDKERSPFLYNREDSLNAHGFYILNSPENNLVDKK